MPATTATLSARQAVAGGLLFIGLLLQISGFTDIAVPSPLVSVTLWLSVILLWQDIPRRTRWQAGCLSGIGVGLLLVARFHYGADIRWSTMLDGNTFVVTMLIGVSFVGLIGNRSSSARPLGRPIMGARGIASTWLGVHLLGTILNLSTVFMIGDRLARQGPLSMPQYLALNRGLSSAALWSPFFASMGVVITLVPGMKFPVVLAFGMPLALCAGLLTLLELTHRFDLDETAGFSLSPHSLLMPVSMASLVMLFHYGLTPELTIVSIITFLLPLAALASNLPRGPRWTLRRIRQHTMVRLPGMRGEVSLFLCAGLLTEGLASFIAAATGSDWQLFARFGALEGVLSFLAIVASAVMGLHPIIGVSVLASMLELDGSGQTLFACVALASWAVGTSVGPLSGINLSLQGRYGVSGAQLMKHNMLYASAMSVLTVVAISALAAWL
ncbi:hypothetical protein KG088_11385 [Halomonas sp. TRM85114]|uniref:hypothetical protein n=1 Tax=Halomonas jincaotanensis TaxID=2810616 RepID=UPI001BD42FD1|nr:hypothetical protein [Halomonas jincaotanensis]MBS9404234.1 hypothetical protein [Halomonas jincaotanensis]